MIVPCNSVKIRGKQVVKGFPRVSVVNLDVKGHNGTHTFVPRAEYFFNVLIFTAILQFAICILQFRLVRVRIIRDACRRCLLLTRPAGAAAGAGEAPRLCFFEGLFPFPVAEPGDHDRAHGIDPASFTSPFMAPPINLPNPSSFAQTPRRLSRLGHTVS